MFKEIAKMHAFFIAASIVIGNAAAGNFYASAVAMVVSFVVYGVYRTYTENMP